MEDAPQLFREEAPPSLFEDPGATAEPTSDATDVADAIQCLEEYDQELKTMLAETGRQLERVQKHTERVAEHLHNKSKFWTEQDLHVAQQLLDKLARKYKLVEAAPHRVLPDECDSVSDLLDIYNHREDALETLGMDILEIDPVFFQHNMMIRTKLKERLVNIPQQVCASRKALGEQCALLFQ